MPLKLVAFSVMIVVGVGLGIGALCASSGREPASTPPSPKKLSGFDPNSRRASKSNPTVDVSIVAVGGFPASNDQVAKLRATVTLRRDFDEDLDLQWVLPAGVQLVAGDMNKALQDLNSGDSVTSEIAVTGFSSEGLPRNVHLEVRGHVDQSEVGSTAVFSSHPTRQDLSVGFRKSADPAASSGGGQAKVESLDDSDTTQVKLPKGIRL